jgi:hypothetical protein
MRLRQASQPGVTNIGGQAHDFIRRAAQTAVEIAAEFQPQMQATSTFPLPKQGEVIFYVLTDAGAFTARAPGTPYSSASVVEVG